MTPEDEELIAQLPPDQRARHAVPDPEQAVRRRDAYAEVLRRFNGIVPSSAVRVSPLGPEWSGDIDVHVPELPDELLAGWGWLRVDHLLRRIGSSEKDRWAVCADGKVLAGLDRRDERAPAPADAVLSRALRRREVRLREVLELRVLLRAGTDLPREHPVLAAAADLEAGFGGGLLTCWHHGPSQRDPVVVGRPRRTLAAARRVRGRLRRRYIVALSGVDGAGKSTLARALAADLDAAGVPATVVWTRPGMGLRALSGLARLVKQATGQRPEPGLRTMAAGGAARPASRRGVLGFAWTVAVTVDFLVTAWREHLRARGVVVCDRHVLDALATLHVFYRGVPLALPSALVRHLLPRAHRTFYLRVPPDVACARKPDEVVRAYAVRAQVAEYDRLLAEARHLIVLDATRPAAQVGQQALEGLFKP